MIPNNFYLNKRLIIIKGVPLFPQWLGHTTVSKVFFNLISDLILASGADDGYIVLNHASTGQKLHTFVPFKNGLSTATVSDCLIGRSSEFLAGAYSDGCVRIFDLKSRKITRAYRSQN